MIEPGDVGGIQQWEEGQVLKSHIPAPFSAPRSDAPGHEMSYFKT